MPMLMGDGKQQPERRWLLPVAATDRQSGMLEKEVIGAKRNASIIGWHKLWSNGGY